MKLTHQRLKEVLSYDEVSGHFFWRKVLSNRVKPGACAGTLCKNGYIYISIDGSRYLAHRLAVFYVTGEAPAKFVDHINGFSTDNRICNLRNASPRINAENRQGPQSNNALGILGVSMKRKKFLAQIVVNGSHRNLGVFDTAEQAQFAYLDAKRAFHEGNTL
jgi:hypothetical protein